jgi:hypothetical protein
MLVLDGTVIYSASDLAAAARCEYALLRSFADFLVLEGDDYRHLKPPESNSYQSDGSGTVRRNRLAKASSLPGGVDRKCRQVLSTSFSQRVFRTARQVCVARSSAS